MNKLSSKYKYSKIYSFIEAGEIFGEIGFISSTGGSIASIVADSDIVELLVLESNILNTLFEWKPQLGKLFIFFFLISVGARFLKYICSIILKRLSLREKLLLEGENTVPSTSKQETVYKTYPIRNSKTFSIQQQHLLSSFVYQ